MYGLRTFAKSARWLRSRIRSGRGVILGYHRVNDCSWDPYSLSVTPECFAEQLNVLRNHAVPVTLRSLTESLQGGDMPSRSVAITLDDGYADNLHHAKSLLQRYECPATVFVATGYLGKKFWWDELAEIMRPPKPLPQTIRLFADGRGFERKFTRPVNTKERKGLVRALYDFMRLLPWDSRVNAIAELSEAVGTKPDEKSTIRAMTSPELHELTAGGLVNIGAHTVTHPFLSTLSVVSQKNEIATSKTDLEKLLHAPVNSFSFPNGSASRLTMQAVREAGFDCACGTYSDVVWRGSDVFHLPRLWAPNLNGVTFARWMKRWLGN